MKVITVVIAIALLGLLFFLFTANKSPASTSLTNKLSMETIQADIKAGAQLIDVRTPEEFNAGRTTWRG